MENRIFLYLPLSESDSNMCKITTDIQSISEIQVWVGSRIKYELNYVKHTWLKKIIIQKDIECTNFVF